MTVPGATTATPYVHVRIASREISTQFSKLYRIAFFEMPNLTERNFFHFRGVWSNTSDTINPIARFNRWFIL